jgi:V8-like Glu-specific endopeptidase
MRTRANRLPFPTLASCLLSFALAALMAPASALGANAMPMHRLASSRRQLRSTVRYWTPGRLRHAAANLRQPIEAGNPGASASEVVASGRPHLVPPRRPSGASASSDPVADPTQLPYRTVGLLVGMDPTGQFGCSATVVASANASTILTAGHCVKERFWTRKAIFVPGYHDGQTPFGIFPAKVEVTTPGWLRSQNDNFDEGAMVLGTNSSGQSVADAVGAVGLATGLNPKLQTFDAYGYPASASFDSNKQWHCQSPFLGTDRSSLRDPGPPTIGIACDMTEGASGGGWLIDGQYVNGMTSYGYKAQPGVLYGPYFGRTVWKLYRSVRGLQPRLPRKRSRHLVIPAG